jgi:serine/threonine protein kinase
MALTREQFVQALVDSGLMTAPDVAALQQTLPPTLTNAHELAEELVRQQRLTPFQAAAVAGGQQLVIGNYVVLGKIGEGGMGQVFKAKHRRMERVVALKVLPSAVSQDERAVQRFQREVKAVARLSHPNIVTAYDADECNGVHFLVMEFVEGCDLASLVQQQGPLPIDQAVDCIVQAARGLEYAHRQGIIHRDIKPANLLVSGRVVSGDHQVKVLDLGLARFAAAADGPAAVPETDTGLTHSGWVLGTADYMAPEQALNAKQADHRADVYSLGCSLYWLLTGRPLYAGQTVVEKIVAHREQPIPSVRPARADVPEDLEAIFRKMVAKDPADRYQSMTEVLAALGPLARSAAPTLPVPAVPTGSAALAPTLIGSSATAGRPTRRRFLRTVSLLAVLLLLAGLGLFALGFRGETADSRRAETERMVTGNTKSSRPVLPDGDRDRKAAQWVQSVKGSLEVTVGGTQRPIGPGDNLPPGPFTITSIHLTGKGPEIGIVLHRLQGLQTLYVLNLKDSAVSDSALADLKDLPQLSSLDLRGTPVTGAGLKHVAQLSGLHVVDLASTKVADEGLEHLERLKRLKRLRLENTAVTDGGLVHLKKLTGLEALSLKGTKVTAAGVASLKAALPNCQEIER